MSDSASIFHFFIGLQLFSLTFVVGIPLWFFAYIRFTEWREDQQRKKITKAALSIFFQTLSSILTVMVPILITEENNSWNNAQFDSIRRQINNLFSNTNPPANSNTAVRPSNTTEPLGRRGVNTSATTENQQSNAVEDLNRLLNEALLNGEFRLTTSVSQPNPSNPRETIIRQTQQDALGNTTTSERVVPTASEGGDLPPLTSTRAQNPLRRPVARDTSTDMFTNLVAQTLFGGDVNYTTSTAANTSNDQDDANNGDGF